MKLCEIYYDPDDAWLDPDNVRTTELDPKSKDIVNQKRSNPNHRYLGAGSYAYVGTDDIKNFGDAHRIADVDDGGSQFLHRLYSNKYVNPYLPRVRKVEKNGTSQVTIIERLVPFNTPSIIDSTPLMKALWNKYFMVEWGSRNRYGEVLDAHDIPILLHNAAYSAQMGRDGLSTIKDPQLADALQYILEVADDVEAEIDLHSGNVMWRMAPYAPQLVITDPLVA